MYCNFLEYHAIAHSWFTLRKKWLQLSGEKAQRVVAAHLDAGRDSYLPMLRPSPWRSADPPNMKTRQDGMASHVAEGDPIKEII